MGILPLQFEDGQGWRSLGLNGSEIYDIAGISDMKSPGEKLQVMAANKEKQVKFSVTARIDNESEMKYFRSGGVLPYVLNRIISSKSSRRT